MRRRGVIAIDIGGTKTLCLLVDERFKIVDRAKFKTNAAEGCRAFSRRLKDATKGLAQNAKTNKVDLIGVGVAAAGRVDGGRRQIVESPNILCLEGFKIGDFLKRSVGLDSVIGNDVRLALYGEHELGVARDCQNVLGVFFGTGVGGAAIIEGRLYSGASGLGGQVGATLAHSIGGPETLESHGILDRIASKAAIAGAAIGMGVKQWAPNLYKETGTDISLVTWGSLSRARQAGDKEIDDLIRSRMRIVGIALSSIINFLNPELLVLGGGLTEEMPRLVVSSVEDGVREYLMPEVSRALKIKAAKFGNTAGALGAARLAFNQFL